MPAATNPPPPDTGGDRLAVADSPLLREWAAQPVGWWPWGEDALAAARARNRPLFVVVADPHCAVGAQMARECFADPEIARLLNEHFVPVLIDGDARADLDRLFRLSHALLNGHGGGRPLTAFLTPQDAVPVFVGGYFPRDGGAGLPPFLTVLSGFLRFLAEEPASVAAQGARLVEALQSLGRAVPSPAGATAPRQLARLAAEAEFDSTWGGFGTAPKVPAPALVELLLTTWADTADDPQPDLRALYMAALTLTRMADGGLQDHLEGGFFTATTDRAWLVPVFEKWLADQAILGRLYAETAIATGDAAFREVAERTAEAALAQFLKPDGGFANRLLAPPIDDEAHYYLWVEAAVRAVMDPGTFAPFARRYGLTLPPTLGSRHHLYAAEPIAAVAAALDRPPAEAAAQIEAGRRLLTAQRRGRAPPDRDESSLTASNALLVRCLATLARRFGRDDFGLAAARLVTRIRTHAFREGRLTPTLRGYGTGSLADHALLAEALLELLQWRYDAADLALLIDLADTLLRRFEAADGGFYSAPHDADAHLVRLRPLADELLPSANGVAVRLLLRLGHLLGEDRYLRAASAALAFALGAMASQPLAHATLIDAAEEAGRLPELVVVRGTAEVIADWRASLALLYAPHRLVLPVPAGAAGLPPALARCRAHAQTVAYLADARDPGPVSFTPYYSLGELLVALKPEPAAG